MEEEVTELLGREKSERRSTVDSAEGYRNGYGRRSRGWLGRRRRSSSNRSWRRKDGVVRPGEVRAQEYDSAEGYRNGYGKPRRLAMSSGTITL